jgi:signal transduction histidine kinase
MGRVFPLSDWQWSLDEPIRREGPVVVARVWLTAFLFVGGFLVPVTTAPRASEHAALGTYFVFALLVQAAGRLEWSRSRPIRLAAHVVDLCAGTAMIHVAAGPGALVVLVLALLGAMHRWGRRGTVATAGASIALLVAAPIVWELARVGGLSLSFVGSALKTALAEAGFVGLTGTALAYVASHSEQLRSESEMVAALTSQAEVRLGLKHTVAVLFDTIVRRFRARRAIAIIRDFSTERVYLWRGGLLTGPSAVPLEVVRLDHGAAEPFLFRSSGSWSAVRRGSRAELDIAALDVTGTPTDVDLPALSETFLEAIGPFDHLMGIQLERPGAWTGRLFLVDAPVGRNRLWAVALGQRLARQICPALDNVALLHRVRSKSAANERARIARELHDGIVQTVMGVQIQLHALSARVAGRSKTLASEQDRLAGLLRDEALNLRDLMQQMKSGDLAPDRLVDTLADTIKRFQYETGIKARFITQFDRVDLPPRACREVARVVQEALVNVRKHSGAQNVDIRFTMADGVCQLSIDDDGRGFPFTGRLTQATIEQPEWPRVINERVRLLGGDMTVVSVPNQGARLDISIPLMNTYAIFG